MIENSDTHADKNHFLLGLSMDLEDNVVLIDIWRGATFTLLINRFPELNK